MLFQDLGLIEPLLKALETEGYTHPTPIQQQAIPVVLQGRDLLGCAQTGTGKTAAFSLPILQLLTQERGKRPAQRHMRVLILTPTRELAIQIDESIAAYGRHTGIRHAVIFGGVGQEPQVQALKRGVDIVTATPGRLLDLMQQGYVHLNELGVFVLDEADRMLDMGFIHDVKKVIAKLPSQRQTLFFSATMPGEIAKLADSILSEPVKVEVTPVSSTADLIEQSVYFTEKKDKKNLLEFLLKKPEVRSALVFTRTKHGANRVAGDLNKAGIRAEAIHGNKSQTARQSALQNFKNGKLRALVATDIAARGIDIDELSHVVNFDLPNIPETYVHRIGRTGRAGASGEAWSLCEAEELPYLKDIQKLIGKLVPVELEHPFAADLTAPSLAATGQNKNNKPQKGQNRQTPQTGRQTFDNNAKPDTGDSGTAAQNNPQPRHEQRPQRSNKPQHAPQGGANGQSQPRNEQRPQQNSKPQHAQQGGQKGQPNQQPRNEQRPQQQNDRMQNAPQGGQKGQPNQQPRSEQRPQQNDRTQNAQQGELKGQPNQQPRNEQRPQQNGKPQHAQQGGQKDRPNPQHRNEQRPQQEKQRPAAQAKEQSNISSFMRNRFASIVEASTLAEPVLRHKPKPKEWENRDHKKRKK